MKVITTKTEVYSFDELSEEVQKKVIEDNYDINVDYYWDEVTLWEAKDNLILMGFNEPEIFYSGFWSQGDGASFTAKVDLQKWLKLHRLSNKYRALYTHVDEFSVSITKSGHYEHEYTMGIDTFGFCETSQKANDQMNEVEALILEDAREEARNIYKALQNEYEYRTMESAIKETLIENEYQFTKEGKIF